METGYDTVSSLSIGETESNNVTFLIFIQLSKVMIFHSETCAITLSTGNSIDTYVYIYCIMKALNKMMNSLSLNRVTSCFLPVYKCHPLLLWEKTNSQRISSQSQPMRLQGNWLMGSEQSNLILIHPLPLAGNWLAEKGKPKWMSLLHLRTI